MSETPKPTRKYRVHVTTAKEFQGLIEVEAEDADDAKSDVENMDARDMDLDDGGFFDFRVLSVEEVETGETLEYDHEL